MEKIQFLVFTINNQQYGIEIQDISSIERLRNYKISSIPNSDCFIEGIINLRGKIIPLISLTKKFNLEIAQQFENAEIVIVSKNEFTAGFIVDEVSDIITLENEDIEKSNYTFIDVNTDYISGIAKVKDSILVILDLIKILSSKEQSKVAP